MHILIISQYFWPENFRINDLACGITERGHKVTVLCGAPNYPEGTYFEGYGPFKKNREKYGDVDVVRVPQVARGKANRVRLALNYLSYAITGSLIGPFALKEKYDAILVFEVSPITMGIPAIIMKWLRNIPVFFWVQDLWPDSLTAAAGMKNRFVLGAVSILVKGIYKNSDRILAQSRAFIPSIANLADGKEKILYYPNSAESLFKPVAVESDAPERKMLPDGFVVMFAGNIGASQNFGLILSAAELLKSKDEIQFVVLGDGRAKPWVEDEIKKRGLSKTVHLLGRHPLESMPRFFSLADALLVTLKDEPIFSLTIPSKVQSYLACGKPIVASLNGEGAGIIEEAGAGYAVPADDHAGLAGAVETLYKMSATDRERLGESGRNYFEASFERDMLVDRLLDWMNEYVKGGRVCEF